MASDSQIDLVILMPVYRDWESAALLCQGLDKHIGAVPGVRTQVLMVDDGSGERLDAWEPVPGTSLHRISALLLRRNLGHQRAIAVGLCYIFERIACDAVLVMDSDGEDPPEAAARLLQCFLKRRITVFAERGKRLEGAVFQGGYLLFRILHRLLTGVPVRMGNFSIVPFSALDRLVCMSELWNHYAGAVVKSRLPFERIRMDRGQRLRGHSHMNLVALVVHGLSGVATFSDMVATRILIANMIGMATIFIVLVVVIAIRLETDLAIPGWTTYAVGLLLILLVQMAMISFSLVFSLMAGHSQVTFVPVRDCGVFVMRVQELWAEKKDTAKGAASAK